MAKAEVVGSTGETKRRAASGNDSAPVSLAAVQGLLRGLNREQRRAVTHRDGPQLVIAGPGTGKTEVVTRRVAWLIATKRALPREILALTFTDAAAQEMQARVDVLVPYGQADAQIHTFHALGDRLLREHAFELGLPGDVRLVNRAEAVMLLREHLFELGLERFLPLGDPTRFLSGMVELFSRAKDEVVTPADYLAHADGLMAALATARPEEAAALADVAAARAEVARAYDAYQRLLARQGLIDHGDQIALALRVLRDRPHVRAQVAGRYRYVLVDEFQDTNPGQLELVLALTGEHDNVTVVGDPDQAIYTFRGAATSNMRRFVAAHPDLRWMVLRRNYRSHAPILEASSRLIGHNRGPADVGTTALGWPVAARRSRAPQPVQRLEFATPDAEEDGVAAHIGERVAAGARPRDFAVLVRTNGEVDSFARSLAVRGLPVRAGTTSPLIGQPVVRALLAYLRVVADPSASMDLYLLAAAEPYTVPGADLAILLAHARRRHASLWQAIGDAAESDSMASLSTAGRAGLRRLMADVRHGLDQAPLRTSGELLYDHLRRSGMLARLAAIEAAAELGGVVRFFDLVRRRAALLAEDRVAFLMPHLEHLREFTVGDEEQAAHDEDAVRVLTIHRAKGLEFRYVYLCGMVDGRFPSHGRPPLLSLPAELLAHRGDASEEDPLAEERRLAYVAMTRARDELWLCHHARGPAGRGRRRPSTFLAEALDTPATALVAQDDPLARLAPPPAPPRAAGSGRRPRRDGAPLMLSYSQLDDYLTCPERYRLRHVVGVPTPAHHALAYGSAMHAAVGAFHLRRAAGHVMTEVELKAALAAAWTGEGFLSRQHEEARFAAGWQALLRFREQQLLSSAQTVAIEKPFSFAVGRDVVRGRMDRVDATADGAVIVDYKSSNVPDQQKADGRARDSLQLRIYALAHEAETGGPPHQVQLHFLDSATVGRAAPQREQLEKALVQIAGAADGIRAGDFAPRPNPIACGYCPFRDICTASAAKVA